MNVKLLTMAVLLQLFGCASAYRPVQLTSTYKMLKSDDLITTNFDNFTRNYYWRGKNRHSEINHYFLLMENTSQTLSYDILLGSSQLINERAKEKIDCFANQKQSLQLAPGKQVRVVCNVAAPTNNSKDTNWEIQIPYKSPQNTGVISYLYRTSKEIN